MKDWEAANSRYPILKSSNPQSSEAPLPFGACPGVLLPTPLAHLLRRHTLDRRLHVVGAECLGSQAERAAQPLGQAPPEEFPVLPVPQGGLASGVWAMDRADLDEVADVDRVS